MKSIVVVVMGLKLDHRKLKLNLVKGLRVILMAIVDITNQQDLVYLN